jgi:transcriptional regulator with XRE-family HTH domain
MAELAENKRPGNPITDREPGPTGRPPLGAKIRELRSEADLTQEALARKIGVKREAIAQIESGANRPSPRTLRGLSEVFDLPIDELKQYPTKPRKVAAPSTDNPPHYSPRTESDVISRIERLESRFDRIESRIDSRIDELIQLFKAAQKEPEMLDTSPAPDT